VPAPGGTVEGRMEDASGRPSTPPLEDVLITRELLGRPSRVPDYETESDTLQQLAPLFAEDPDTLLQRLAEIARESCGAAESAGVGLLEIDKERGEVFRWAATLGPMARLSGEKTARADSPCSIALDLGSAQLFREPQRCFASLRALAIPIAEALIIPLHHGGEQLGTLWVASHAADRRFDQEDARLLSNLAGFTAASLRLQRHRVEAEAANEAKERLLLRVSHDLRQPLHAILGWVEMLRRGAIDPAKIPAAYEAIDQNVLMQDELLSNLLDLSAITGGALPVVLRPVDVCSIIEALVDRLVPLSFSRQVTVRCDIQHPVRMAIADEQRLRQIISNLLLNAIKFTPENGHVTITVREEDDRVTINVRDTGVGVSPEFLGSMFEPFQQGTHAVRGRERGLGIGLTIVRELVAACGGTIRAHSEGVGRGTTMVVQLPISADADVPAA
jgi:signal transduction histidine kinase